MLSMEHLPGVEVSFTEAHQELNRIQQSREFRASKRCFDFLHYIVTRTLSGEESGWSCLAARPPMSQAMTQRFA